jgi:hypothetical protein
MRQTILLHSHDVCVPRSPLWHSMLPHTPFPRNPQMARPLWPHIHYMHAVVHGDVAADTQHGSACWGADQFFVCADRADGRVGVREAAPVLHAQSGD